MESPKIGEEIKLETTVTKDMLASTVGSGTVDVYATPMVVALMEQAAAALAKQYIEDAFTTVGTKIAIDHVSATPLNAKVYATATLTESDGRKFVFTVEAYDEAGLIAKGSHERFSVHAEKFLQKANAKLG